MVAFKITVRAPGRGIFPPELILSELHLDMIPIREDILDIGRLADAPEKTVDLILTTLRDELLARLDPRHATRER